MKVYVVLISGQADEYILGVYTTEELAVVKLEDEMDRLTHLNEDLGVYPSITILNIDDTDKDDYT